MTAHPSSRVLTAIPNHTQTSTICCTWPGCHRAVLILGHPEDTYVQHELANLYGWTLVDDYWICPGDRPIAEANALPPPE